MSTTDAHEIGSKFGSPHARRCGAKTRRGAPCRNLAVRSMKRCRMHGGKSPKGFAHPNYQHGLHSKHCPFGLVLRHEIRETRWRAKRQREFDKILARERLEREAVEARERERRGHIWNEAQLLELAKIVRLMRPLNGQP